VFHEGQNGCQTSIAAYQFEDETLCLRTLIPECWHHTEEEEMMTANPRLYTSALALAAQSAPAIADPTSPLFSGTVILLASALVPDVEAGTSITGAVIYDSDLLEDPVDPSASNNTAATVDIQNTPTANVVSVLSVNNARISQAHVFSY
jgi:hypothetical protein